MATYTKEQLKEIVLSCTSYRQILLKLNLAPQGGNYNTVKKLMIKWGIDHSHLTGQSQTGTRKPRTVIELYLNNEMPCGSFRLKNRLIKEKFFTHTCSNCKKDDWLGKPIPLELDHIDGNTNNNNLNNLRLLCPNCHALTPTYRGRNQSRAN